MRLRDTDLSWFAGVLDASGTISRTSGGVRSINVSYGKPDRHPIIDRMNELTGQSSGKVLRSAPANREFAGSYLRKACIEHCPEPHVHVYPKTKTSYRSWRSSGVCAYVIAWNCYPYLTAFKIKADSLMDGYRPPTRANNQTEIRLSALIEIGWQMPDDLEVAA